MRNMVIALLLLGGATACNGQNEQNKQAELKTEQGKPQSNWKVNKEYDKDGNLVRYDSTYMWTYSSKDGKMQNVDADSVLVAFRNRFSRDFPSFFNDDFDKLKMNDSSVYKDFGMPDYFMKTWEQHERQMGMMMRRMDSLRNDFLKDNYPKLNTRPKEQNVKLKTL